MFTWIIYKDKDGRWLCPVDEETNTIKNRVRYDADAFLNQWLEGVVIKVIPIDEHPEYILDKSKRK